MCSLARPSALGCFDAAAFLDRRRGVSAVAPAACGVMAREPPPPRRAGAGASSAARTQKRARACLDDGKAGVGVTSAAGKAPVVVPAPPGQQRLQQRMRAELDAVRALHRKAVLLCRGGAGRSGAGTAKGDARREAPLEAAAKRRKASPPESATEAAARQKKEQVKQQQAAPAPSAKEDAQKKKREMEEMAREREECRRLVLAMEMAALPDETVYRHELEELGITPFEYAVTRTRSQALCGCPR
ncbi:unnamed protein product [Urochloa humidicola]